MPSRQMRSRYPKCAPSQNDSRHQPTHSAISNLAKPNPATTTATPNSTLITSRPRTRTTTKTPWRICDDNITATTSNASSAGFGPAEAQFDPEGGLGGVCLRHRPKRTGTFVVQGNWCLVNESARAVQQEAARVARQPRSVRYPAMHAVARTALGHSGQQ